MEVQRLEKETGDKLLLEPDLLFILLKKQIWDLGKDWCEQKKLRIPYSTSD